MAKGTYPLQRRPADQLLISSVRNGRPLGGIRKTWYSAYVKAGLGKFDELEDVCRSSLQRCFTVSDGPPL